MRRYILRRKAWRAVSRAVHALEMVEAHTGMARSLAAHLLWEPDAPLPNTAEISPVRTHQIEKARTVAGPSRLLRPER